MKQLKAVFHAGTEGGSVAILYNGKHYSYSTNEMVFLDLLPGEFKKEELRRVSLKFDTFEEAFLSMLGRYRIFHFFPQHIEPAFLAFIETQFLKFKAENLDGSVRGFYKWEEVFELGFVED